MSRGKNLQEIEVGTKQSKTAVNASAKPADSMQKLTTGIPDGQIARVPRRRWRQGQTRPASNCSHKARHR